MANYVTLFKWTEQGVKNAKDTVTRVQEATTAFERAGGKIVAVYWTLGEYDLVAIFDFPNDEAFAAASLGLARGGNVRGVTMRAFNAEEMSRIVAKLS